MMPGDRRALLVLIALWVISTGLWLNPGITKPDGVGYYVYLPSLRIDGDLLFFNEWGRFGMIDRGLIQHKEVTSTDHLGNHWTVGSALYWMPSFLLADAARMLPGLNGFARDGVSLPYNVAVGFASAVAGLLTLGIGFSIARRYVSAFPAVVAAAGLWFGTPLLFYSSRNPILSHAPSAFSCALVVLMSLRLRIDRSAAGWFASGLAAGFAFIVRPQNGVFLLVPLIIATASGRTLVQRAALLLGGFAVAAVPQAIVSQVLYGTPYGFLTGGGAAKPFAAFERIWVWEPIFSWYHGLIPWSPFIALGLGGLLILWKRDRPLAAAGLFVFTTQWFVNATLERSFWGAQAFGQRRFDNCAVFFLVGAAILLSRWPRPVQLIAVGATSLWTMSIFFATMSSLDLSLYYTPSELAGRQLAALSSVVSHMAPLSSVPLSMKGTVAVLCVLFAAAWIGAGSLLFRLGRGRVVALTAAVTIYIAAMSLVLALAGSNGGGRLSQFRTLIEVNRVVATALGGADARGGLLSDEATYLRKAGRIEAAERTERELAELERARREGIQRLQEIGRTRP